MCVFNSSLENYTRNSRVEDEEQKKVLFLKGLWLFNFLKGGHLQKSLRNFDLHN